MKVLKVALENGRYDLAAHTLILATLQTKEKDISNNGKKRSPEVNPDR